MPAQSRLIFVNLPVKDLDAAVAFFRRLGFEFDRKFTDDSAACMVVSEQAYVMLLVEPGFADFTKKPVADARASTEAILAPTAESREGGDAFADAALAGGASPANDPMDTGSCTRGASTTSTGHLWEVMWMSQEAIEQGRADMSPAA